jgi:hypothetical protein
MDERRRILVISSCTSLKATSARAARIRAEQLYAGEQHRRLMRGVQCFRAASPGYELDLKILSAGHGLVDGAQRLSPYEASFSGLSLAEIDRRAEALGIPRRCSQLLTRPYALILLLLGDDYARAASLGAGMGLGGPTIAFGGRRLAQRLGEASSLKVVSAGREQARRFSCGLVGLKGELAGRLLESLARNPKLISRVADADLDVLSLLETPRTGPTAIAA